MCNKLRKCSKCGKELPLTEEFFSKNQSTNTGGDKYFRPDCKACYKKMIQGRSKAFKKAGKPNTPNFGYDKTVRMTVDGYPCDNCGRTSYPKQIVFDHDHDSLEFRGWLCDSCNRSLGILGDDIDGLCNALSYVLRRKISGSEIKSLLENNIRKNDLHN
jgi:hypothetical protein